MPSFPEDPSSWLSFWDSHGFKLVKDIVFTIVAATTVYQFGDTIYRRGIVSPWDDLKEAMSLFVFKLIRKVPLADSKIREKVNEALSEMEEGLLPPHDLPIFSRLPQLGMPIKEIEGLLEAHKSLDTADVSGGRVSGTVYSMDDKLRKASLMAYEKFLYSNPLHPDVFRAARKMEAEVVAMTLSMFGGDEECVGAVTSGGTESILLAMLAYRQRARLEKGILFPEIVAPVTAHAAFDKAACYFGIRLVKVDVDGVTGRVDVEKMRKLITSNTIVLVGSTPCFSLGVADEIDAIAALAKEHGIGCHVDCCLGSFLAPQIAKEEGWGLFDFRCPGVTSISCDTHKYGFTPKGTSVILYRGGSLRSYQYFVTASWTGGIYASPTLAGSRPGALVAATWASLLAAGEETYVKAAQHIRHIVRYLVEGVTVRLPDLFIYGKPATSVVAFGSKTLNVYAINDQMSERGWHLNALQNPPAFHIACTMLTTVEAISDLINDLEESVNAVKQAGNAQSLKQGTAAIYGTTAAIPNKSIIEDVAKGYIDILYKLK